MSLTLFINKSDSHCECFANISDIDTVTECPKCGGTFTHVSSEYAGMGLDKFATKLRPDLIPYFPWEDWWASRAGKQAAEELGAL